MSTEDQETLSRIRKHLNDLHTAWENDPKKDGHHKSNEGYIGVFMYYPNWFEAGDYLNDVPEVGCEIYSYLFGPGRLHQFKSLRDAWDEVKTWEYSV